MDNGLLKLAGKCSGFVYCLYDPHNNICRIGKTESNNGKRQLSQIQYYPFELEIITIKVNYYSDTETFLHRKFNDKKLRADWYKITSNDFIMAINEYKTICKIELKQGTHPSQSEKRKYDLRYIPVIGKNNKIIFKKQ